MKKLLSGLMIIVLLVSFIACVPKEDTQEPDADETVRIALLLNGTLGDKSFFDSADRGLKMAKEEFGDAIEVKTVEMSNDETKWEPTLLDYCDDGTWDVIIGGTWQMVEPISAAAVDYPDQKFFVFDDQVDYSQGYDNVYSILFKQNEVSFLAGALAAKITTSQEIPMADPADSIIGFLGGMDNPVISDFLVGYIQGAQYIDEDVKVVVSYIGNFYDSAKGKDLALAQYQQNGVDIGFNVAGSGGLGQIDAAVETKKYAIGVDSDQAIILGEPSSKHIPVSAMKNVDNAIYASIAKFMDGTLEFGKAASLGIKEGGVGLSDNSIYQSMVPESMRVEIADLQTKIESGEIEVDTAFGKTTEEIKAIVDAVQ